VQLFLTQKQGSSAANWRELVTFFFKIKKKRLLCCCYLPECIVTWSGTLREENTEDVWEKSAEGDIWPGTGENYIKRCLIWAVYQVLLVWLNRCTGRTLWIDGKWDVLGIAYRSVWLELYHNMLLIMTVLKMIS